MPSIGTMPTLWESQRRLRRSRMRCSSSRASSRSGERSPILSKALGETTTSFSAVRSSSSVLSLQADSALAGASPAPNRRTQRNSLADLATLYKSQLSALWEGVEGSQKLLPYIAGRHLIAESATFVELNSATYKPKQHVHLFLLNDALLVSVKKRRGTGLGGKVRLVAERYFNLSEIVVVDLKDGGGAFPRISFHLAASAFPDSSFVGRAQ